MNVRVAALLAGTLACTYPKLPLLGDGRPPNDGRLPDSLSGPDGNPNGCPLLPSYDVTFTPGSGSGVGTEAAVNFGSSQGFTQVLAWNGLLSSSPSATLLVQLSSGMGSQTPDWPSGNVTPKSGIAIGSNSLDAAIAIAANATGSDGFPVFGYLATVGTLNVTQTSPNLAGTATNVSLQRWDGLFGGAAFGPDPDGCLTSVPSLVFDAPVMNQGSSGSAG